MLEDIHLLKPLFSFFNATYAYWIVCLYSVALPGLTSRRYPNLWQSQFNLLAPGIRDASLTWPVTWFSEMRGAELVRVDVTGPNMRVVTVDNQEVPQVTWSTNIPLAIRSQLFESSQIRSLTLCLSRKLLVHRGFVRNPLQSQIFAITPS